MKTGYGSRSTALLAESGSPDPSRMLSDNETEAGLQ
jgi:hypothetical protein